MYTKELQYIEGYRMFSDMLENLQKNQSNILGSNISKHQISNKSEKNFLDILDFNAAIDDKNLIFIMIVNFSSDRTKKGGKFLIYFLKVDIF